MRYFPGSRRSAAFSALTVLALSALFGAGSPRAATYTVELDGSGDYPTIQDAVTAAGVGDTVLVGPGTYTWTNQGTDDNEFEGVNADLYGMVVLWRGLPRGITIRSVEGPEQTILDAEYKGRVFFANGNNVPGLPVEFTIEGFAMTRGQAPQFNEQRPEVEGGAFAFHLVQPTVINCVIKECRAQFGGAAWLGNTEVSVYRDCSFLDNEGQIGGALFIVNSDLETRIENCVFRGNTATGIQDSAGGAIAVFHDVVTIEDCLFEQNFCDRTGGALWIKYGKPVVIRNTWISDNESNGAIVNLEWSAFESRSTRVEIESTMIHANDGPGLRLDAEVLATISCTNIYLNRGGNWFALAGEFLGEDGNISEDPLLCLESEVPLAVRSDSPMLAANHDDCDEDIAMTVVGCEPDIPPYTPPPALLLKAAYPNPLRIGKNDAATIEYELPSASSVRIEVYNLAGAHIATLKDIGREEGPNLATWDGRDSSGKSVASGVYVVRVEAAGSVEEGRVVVLH